MSEIHFTKIIIMFIGRDKEIKQIKQQIENEKPSAILIYGKRRIGKSFLINEILKSYSCHKVYYECLNASFEENLRKFEDRIKSEFNNSFLHFESFQDAFSFLGTTKQKVIVVLDEYSYLKSSREKKYVDSVFQNIIDSLPENVDLVLLGSYVSIMRELLEEDDPLFGRFSLIIHLKGLDYYTSSAFYKGKTVKEKIDFYSVFGSSPFINSFIDSNTDLKSNIIRLILDQNSSVRSYLENILLHELSKTGPSNTILSVLSNGKKRYSQIEAAVNPSSAGALDKQLKNLISMDIIDQKYPINKKNDKKKTFYEISDNLVRFYYTYVFSNRDIIRTIGEESFFDLYINPSLKTFISFRFENIVREYFEKEARLGNLKDVYDIGTYWYDDSINNKNGEFDCVLKHKESYSFYEVKYYDKPLNLENCKEEEREVRRLTPELTINKIGFVSLNGFDFNSNTYDLVPAEDLYEDKSTILHP